MLSLQLREFLLGGPQNIQEDYEIISSEKVTASDQLKVLQRIESHSNSLASEWQILANAELEIGSSFDSILKDVAVFREKVDDPELQKKIRQYSSLQSQIHLCTLAKALFELNSFKHVRDIPDLVHNLMGSLPKHLQRSCKIHKNIISTVISMKETLLKSFHADFNAHLESNEDSEDAKEMWSNFLIVARDWLVAYALVSLLPILISDSRSQILEKYTEALDEALTPLWGRFHFHLTSARESKSFEQFVWTFSYAKSFVSLLINLCTQLTAAGQLQDLDPGDFKSAALHHITEKAVRFMRAHLAQAIVDASPMTSKECMRLVESSLDFDHALSQSFLPSLTVCAVLYDARTVHAQWVEADYHFFTAYICHTCKDDEALYSFRQSFSSVSEGGLLSDHRSPPPSHDTAKCFSGVFDSLYILSLGLSRYEGLPHGSQDLFSRAILEPLLVISVGLFLYRIRSCSVLYAISNGILPPQAATDRAVRASQLNALTGSKVAEADVPQVMVDFRESAEYFQQCLGSIAKHSRDIKASKSRFQDNWRKSRDSFPDDLLKENATESGYSAVDLVKSIMQASSPLEIEQGQGEERGDRDRDRERDKPSERGAAKPSPEDATMGAVIDHARAQILTMSGILESQWSKVQGSLK